MSFRIIGDSCLDPTREMRDAKKYRMVPCMLQVDDKMIADDDDFDQKEFIRLVSESPNCPKSACPSPEAFKNAMICDEDDVFVITLSSHLSGTYNSARLGRELYLEEFGPKNILVIDSESASTGQLNIALTIEELYAQGMNFEEVSKAILEMRDRQKTYFIVDTLEPLRKNGRLTGLQAFFATALNIKPVMGADHGVIIKLDQVRGMKKAFGKMCDIGVKEADGTENRNLIIAHCNCPERAEQVKAEFEKRASFKQIVITETAGISTLYAADGGIIVAIG